jgi:hypothetical protein
MQRWWEAWQGGVCAYAGVQTGGVIVGSTCGTGLTDNATTATDEAFLAGELHDLILRDLGRAVLDAMLDAVRARTTPG